MIFIKINKNATIKSGVDFSLIYDNFMFSMNSEEKIIEMLLDALYEALLESLTPNPTQ